MLKLRARGLKWLKGVHLVAVSCWIGGGVSLLLLYFLKQDVADGGVLYGINRSIHHVDMAVVVVPGAFGCLLTGLVYSLCSGWGFFKHGWIVLKWGVTITAILFGTFFLGPWETTMMEISGRLGLAALEDAAYRRNEQLNLWFGTLQVLVLLTTVFISVFKPWRAGSRKKARPSAGPGSGESGLP